MCWKKKAKEKMNSLCERWLAEYRYTNGNIETIGKMEEVDIIRQPQITGAGQEDDDDEK